MYENKGEGRTGVRYQVSGVREEVRSPGRQQRISQVRPFCLLSRDSCLLPFKYEGDSGDMYENKGTEK